jgi:transposase InsO family protein
VLVPPALRLRALRHVHAAHMGMVRTKALSRVLFWWPGVSADIEKMVATCPACQATRARSPRLPTTPWPSPGAPWSRLHIDFAGPFMGKHFLVVVDAHSGWADAYEVRGPTTEETMRCLNVCFRFNGLPYSLVSDNGSAFIARKFRDFCAQRGIKQLFTAPRHPSSNGRAERYVRTLKEILRRLPAGVDFQEKLDIALESLRSTPGKDGLSPAQRLMGRAVRTAVSLVIPAPEVQTAKLDHAFSPGDTVWYQRHGDTHWRPATVQATQGARMLRVSEDGTSEAVRHVDQLRRRQQTTATVKGPPKVLPDLPANQSQSAFVQPQVPPLVTDGGLPILDSRRSHSQGVATPPAGSANPQVADGTPSVMSPVGLADPQAADSTQLPAAPVSRDPHVTQHQITSVKICRNFSCFERFRFNYV